MLVGNSQFLDSTRITRIIQDQATRYQKTIPLRFIDRLYLAPAEEDEIIARITTKNFAAPLVADDQVAPVYQSIKLDFVTNAVPNIKPGESLPQSLLSKLDRIARNVAAPEDDGYFRNWEVALSQRLLRNAREQMNVLACAMMLDTLSYSRNGVVVNASWGAPSDLKATSSPLWTSTSATPITDITTMVQHAANTYGEVYDRVTLSTADLTNAWATTEFKALVAGLTEIASPIATSAINTRDPRNKRFFSELINMEVEVDDKTYNIINPDGTQSSGKVLPLGKVILSNSGDDSDPGTADFANGVVTESVASRLCGNVYNFPAGEMYGPVAYYAPKSHDLNPPGINAFAVVRGFPRKHRLTAFAVLTVQ